MNPNSNSRGEEGLKPKTKNQLKCLGLIQAGEGWDGVCIDWCIICISVTIIFIIHKYIKAGSDYGVNISVKSVVISQTVLSTGQLSHSTGQPCMAHNPKKGKKDHFSP